MPLSEETVGGYLSSDCYSHCKGGNYYYSYDAYGNITSITENGTVKATYTYDYLGELTRENNLYANKTITYQYDNGGNIVSKTIYPYTTEISFN